MANIPMKDIQFPGLDDKYTFAQIDNTLTQTGQAADAKKTGDEISELKADLTAVETDIETGNLTAGTAKQLLADTGLTDKSPYLFRAMPTGAGDREEPSIVGGSVVWNQLSKINSMAWSSSGYNGITITKVDDATLHVSGTATAVAQARAYTVPNSVLTPRAGHIFYMKSGDSRVCMYIGNSSSDYSEIITRASTISENTVFFYIPNGSDFGANGIDIKPQIIDLTAMLPAAIVDYIMTITPMANRVAWLKRYFMLDKHYPFCEPTFKHVEGLVSHKMVGFNQWSEVWENGAYSGVGGAVSSSTRIRSKVNTPIVALPNTAYYFYCGSAQSASREVFYYDANDTFISYKTITANGEFTTPAKCRYIRFDMYGNYGATYKNDICINLSDPAKNGTYEPYKEYTYPLGSDVVLRGPLKLDSANNLYFDGDTYQPDGTVERRYIEVLVDGGVNGIAFSGVWGAEANGYVVYISTGLGARSYNAISDRFIVSNAGIATMPLMSFVGNSGSSSTWSFVLPSTVTSLAEANTWASNNPFHIIIPRSTPTTETADPYAPLQIADPYGTEEWVLDDEAFPMPVGQETFYPENLRAKIEGLPWNFANLIAPTEVSNVATRNYTAGNLLIVDNVLYKVTVNIANGGTITPGTNVVATTLAEIISALQ